MGRMSDLHLEMMQEARELFCDWEDLSEKIIAAAGFKVERCFAKSEVEDFDEQQMADNYPDFIAIDEEGKRVAFDLKVYRWEGDAKRHYRSAADHLSQIVKKNELSRGVLIITWDLPVNVHDFPDGVDVWDIRKLIEISKGDRNLINTLEDLSGETWIEVSIFEDLADLPLSPQVSPSRGRDLSMQLKASKEGRDGWKDFESICEESFRYLFSDSITSWKAQNATSDGLNRMDLIGRVKGDTKDFWSDISRDFGARYIVFEAKNYSEKITQDQVLTTEKYLYKTALRTVALIVARKGAGDQAIKAAEGALREHGKLIVILDMETLCSLLEGYERGESPENTLYSIVDTMLMAVGR